MSLAFASSFGVGFNTVSHSTPPHTIIFERNPQVLTRAIQQAAKSIEVLGASLAALKFFLNYPLDDRKIRVEQKLNGYVRPARVDLSVCFSRLPPLPARAVFHIANRIVRKRQRVG